MFPLIRSQRIRRRLYLPDEVPGGGTAVALQLASDEVDGLDAVGALIDAADADVTHVLRRPGFLDETHAAMHLDAD